MDDELVIIGAGLVGSLLALRLRQEGFAVSVYEKRADPRATKHVEGRSINLALSHRGIRTLKQAKVFELIEPTLIPMHGRMMHSMEGELTFQPYGKEGQFINSVSRSDLNKVLIEQAEEAGVSFHFEHKCDQLNMERGHIQFQNGVEAEGTAVIGADGAFSAVRSHYQQTDRFNYQQRFIGHGYKELTIEPINGEFALEPNYLHIWPRGNFMLIALPNYDKTFTCTLFFPFEGDPSFDSLSSEEEIDSFFRIHFSDAVPLLPNLVGQFQKNPTSSLVTISCDPWHRGRTALIGDAAHAVVPFYGQGMNSGFEDIRIFMEIAAAHNYHWEEVLPRFSSDRKKDADAISELALYNFLEMRDYVGDPDFLKRKKLEAELQEQFPDDWLPLYSMVTFSDIPYSEAQRVGRLQSQVMREFLSNTEGFNHQQVIDRFKSLTKDGKTAHQ